MDLILRTPEKTKNGSLMILGVRGVQVEIKNRRKFDQKMRSTWEGILAPIFNLFWTLGAKLGPKIDPRSIQKGIEKTKEK